MQHARCGCLCHSKSVLPWGAPLLTDPVAALTACALCAPLHRGVWRVVPRGYSPPPAEPWRDSGEGEE